MTKQCPCYSGKLYEECCKPFHEGKTLPETPLQLMRSRYAAYAKQNSAYIIDTTHPQNPNFVENKVEWTQSILLFCKQTQFTGLKIVDWTHQGNEGYVTFIAHLIQQGHDVSFEEKSHFKKVKNRWLYLEGIYLKPHKE